MKNEKGITLIVLVLTIIMLIIITTTLIAHSYTSLEASGMEKLKGDIKVLEDRVASYYVKNDSLPTLGEPISKNTIENTITDLNVNDGGTYYILDLEKLDNPTLNFGNGYKSSENDKYIINEETHQIYYFGGITYEGEIHHTTGNYGSPSVSEREPTTDPPKEEDGVEEAEEALKDNTKVPYVIKPLSISNKSFFWFIIFPIFPFSSLT